MSPPQDHPHIYIDMGEADTILCPYCGTRFRFDPRLAPLNADPPDSFFADHNAACAEPRRRTGPIAFTRFGRVSPRFQWYSGKQVLPGEIVHLGNVQPTLGQEILRVLTAFVIEVPEALVDGPFPASIA